MLAALCTQSAAQMVATDPATRAFEEGRWADAIAAYRQLVSAVEAQDDEEIWLGLTFLRIAQAERELGRHQDAMRSLDRAAEAEGPEAMVHFERARNLASLGRLDEAMAELEISEHVGLRALQPLVSAPEFSGLRGRDRFQRVERGVRDRVYACEAFAAFDEFDFWVGRWEVRAADGSLAGHSTVTRGDGGCSLEEQWESVSGSTGRSVSFYVPSMDQWRQVWVGSGGTLFDITGGLVDGQMRMQGTVEYVTPERVSAFRGAWSVVEDGVVRQHLEEYDSVTSEWRTWFDGYFHRAGGRQDRIAP